MSVEDVWATVEMTVASAMGPDAFLDAVRVAMLEAHVEACGETVENGKAPCGGAWRGMTWYCDKAQAIQKLGKEPVAQRSEPAS